MRHSGCWQVSGERTFLLGSLRTALCRIATQGCYLRSDDCHNRLWIERVEYLPPLWECYTNTRLASLLLKKLHRYIEIVE